MIMVHLSGKTKTAAESDWTAGRTTEDLNENEMAYQKTIETRAGKEKLHNSAFLV